ncbi:head-tail connector protein [uncultured Dubosiella sp.]|uniref:head-tail connector protein n=1 Tax=uncultured Dubosiella sp. TaxID=1937011 RepID=UPI00272DE558|nr:head-tail connector protein [uncultured Dubosiella sp.]
MATITNQEAWEYLGFFEEPDPVTLRTIERTIATAEKYVRGAIGAYGIDDPRAKELVLLALGFLYDNRSLEGKGSGQMTRMAQSLMTQLRCEWRK